MADKKIICPLCGNSEFDEEWILKNVFLCRHKNEDGKECPNSIIYCKQCDKQYPESEFGKHGDVWECKQCNTVHWGFTDLMRYREETRNLLFSEIMKFHSIEKEIDNL